MSVKKLDFNIYNSKIIEINKNKVLVVSLPSFLTFYVDTHNNSHAKAVAYTVENHNFDNSLNDELAIRSTNATSINHILVWYPSQKSISKNIIRCITIPHVLN